MYAALTGCLFLSVRTYLPGTDRKGLFYSQKFYWKIHYSRVLCSVGHWRFVENEIARVVGALKPAAIRASNTTRITTKRSICDEINSRIDFHTKLRKSDRPFKIITESVSFRMREILSLFD